MCFRNGGRLHDCLSFFHTLIREGWTSGVTSFTIVVVPLYSKRPIVNNNINKVGKYPVVGFFSLVDGFVVIVIAMTEA